MFLPFFLSLRRAGVPVSLREHLALLEALQADLVTYDVEGFYHLSRMVLVKSEAHLDRFDQVFAACFGGLDAIDPAQMIKSMDLPEEWLRKLLENTLTPEEMAEVKALGGFEALMEALKQRLAEQKERHQGGSKWIGTAGTSPFGAYGYNPEGVRIGQESSRHRRAAKVWDRREFKDFDDQIEIGTRQIKVALRQLRRWARTGAVEELDLPGTIRASAEHGFIDVKTRPERRNAAKVLLLLDVGGSMDDHVHLVSELFSAARSAFSQLEQFYFHNCVYEGLWRDSARRWTEQVQTRDVLNTYGPGWHLIIVGDAAMSPYEIAMKGGANEHWNEESGETWLRRLSAHWPRHLWINPLPEAEWDYTRSIKMVQDCLTTPERMVPLTLAGLTQGMKLLSR